MARPFRIEGFKAWLFFTPNQYVRAPRKFMCCGARSVATAAEPTAPEMPSYGWQLDDGQVAAVLTYVRNTWGAAAPAVSAQAVGRARSDFASRTD